MSFETIQHNAATKREWHGARYGDMERSLRSIPKLKTQTAKDWITYNPFCMHCDIYVCVCIYVYIGIEMKMNIDVDIDIHVDKKLWIRTWISI